MTDNGPAEKGSRTFVLSAFAATLYHSARVVNKSVRGRLSDQFVERVLHDWTRHLFNLGDINLTVSGLEHVDTSRGGYVVMSNHQSLADVPCVIRAFPGRVRMVAKKELGQVPVFGQAMRDAGCVIIDRDDRQKAIEQLKEARSLLEAGTSLWISPEGTRSPTGALLPFKKGGFHVAVDLQVPILPVYIDGTRDILETKSLSGRRGIHVDLRFGPAIETAGCTKDDIGALIAQTRDAIESLQGHRALEQAA